MSESREPSYYEIALTNTQVLVAFGILLVCVAGAFVSGMWVARESLRDRLEVAEVAASVAPGTAEGEAEQETFEFFGDEPAAGRAGQAAEGAAPPLLPPLESRAATAGDTTATKTASVASAEPPAEVPPAPTAAPDQGGAVTAEVAERRASEAEPAVVARDAASTPVERERGSPQPGDAGAVRGAAPAAADESQPGVGAVVIQVFSSVDETQANGLITRLRADGYRAFLSPVDVDGRTMYRVRVGPYDNREAAEVDAEKLKRNHRLDTWFPRS